MDFPPAIPSCEGNRYKYAGNQIKAWTDSDRDAKSLPENPQSKRWQLMRYQVAVTAFVL